MVELALLTSNVLGQEGFFLVLPRLQRLVGVGLALRSDIVLLPLPGTTQLNRKHGLWRQKPITPIETEECLTLKPSELLGIHVQEDVFKSSLAESESWGSSSRRWLRQSQSWKCDTQLWRLVQ